MDLYKYEEPNRYRSDNTAYFGYIDERRVDSFNGLVKVFIPLGYREPGISMPEFRDLEVKLYNMCKSEDLISSEWLHLSTREFTEVSKRERNWIKEALKREVEKCQRETVHFANLLDKL